MSFGAGHIMDMANRMRQNRALLASKRSKFKENNREGIYSSHKEFQHLSYKTLPEKELNQRKKQIRERIKVEQKRELIIYGLLTLFVMIFLVGILLWLS